tara:strand:+ start:1852 stop:2622 length:771 start_codon:yes stop_codon:yes gene_type:complete
MAKNLQIEKSVDGNLKPIKDSDGTNTSLEVSSEEVRAKDLTANSIEIPSVMKTLSDRVVFGSSETEIRNDGNVTLAGKLNIPSTKQLSFDGGGDTYIIESSDDVLDIHVGSASTEAIKIEEDSTFGRSVSFETSGVGFTQGTPSYDATNTAPNFRESNKQFVTFGAGNITNMKLYFTRKSSNCTLVVKQDGTGSRTVTNWLAYDSGGSSASGSSTVKWAGGSAPTLSTGGNAIDIISFYWDATNEVAYGVASLNFS